MRQLIPLSYSVAANARTKNLTTLLEPRIQSCLSEQYPAPFHSTLARFAILKVKPAVPFRF
jgi:hypothetical protein